MTVYLEYYLQQFRDEQKELFDENGNAYTTVSFHKPAERMLMLINQLEKELIEADKELEQYGCE